MPLCISFFIIYSEYLKEKSHLFCYSSYRAGIFILCNSVISLLREFVSPYLSSCLLFFFLFFLPTRYRLCVCVQLPDRLQPVSSEDQEGMVNSHPSAVQPWPVQILLSLLMVASLAVNPNAHSAVPKLASLLKQSLL